LINFDSRKRVPGAVGATFEKLHPVESIIHAMEKASYYIINAITFYRVLAAPVLFLLIFTGQTDLFKWLLGLSFFTDAIDGYLARRYKVISVAGARLDSLGDDLTVLAGIIGLFVLRNDFISGQYLWVAVLLVLLAVQVVAALIEVLAMSLDRSYTDIQSFCYLLARQSLGYKLQ
jgi:CDP-diacylglycerol--glycerol-3-phosphate 3-phosphatidyltransferase